MDENKNILATGESKLDGNMAGQAIKSMTAKNTKNNVNDAEPEFWNSLLSFFSSLKLAISLFIVLAITSIIGTVVEQGKDPASYMKEYGVSGYKLVKFLGFTDLYHSWWFTSLLLALTVNAFVCFSRKIPKIWKSVRSEKVNVSLSFIKRLKLFYSHALPFDHAASQSIMEKTLRKRHYAVKILETEKDITLFATKGVIGRLGAQIAHLSILIVMVGAMMGSIWGMRDHNAMLEGETYFLQNKGDFSVRVDRFWIEYYKTGGVKDFFSKLTIFDNNKEVMTKQIQVNDPLQYKGVWLYQSSYGDSWDRIRQARIQIKDKETNRKIDEVVLDWGKEYIVTDLGITLKIRAFVSDFAFDPKNKVVYTSAADHENPSVQLEITENGKFKGAPWIFLNYPEIFELAEATYKYELVGYTPHKYTGLQIAYDPGVNVVWAGFALMTLGLFMSSFVFHRRIWVKITKGTNKSEIFMGGNTNKNSFDFKRELNLIISDITKVQKS